jgi:hypothetical protein
MSTSAAVARGGLSGMHKAWVSVCVFLGPAPLPKPPANRNAAPHHGNQASLTTYLIRVAACVGALFAACIVIEVFDADLALWPFGSEDFVVAPAGYLGSGTQASPTLSALHSAYGFVVAAGAHLVVRYRARSALAADQPSEFVVFHRAEPWGRHDDWRPGARPLYLVDVGQ